MKLMPVPAVEVRRLKTRWMPMKWHLMIDERTLCDEDGQWPWRQETERGAFEELTKSPCLNCIAVLDGTPMGRGATAHMTTLILEERVRVYG